jgi:hypothetical protein
VQPQRIGGDARQHRAHAAKRVGLTEVPALIVDLDQAAQARAFVAINVSVTAVTQHHILRAALASGEPWAIAARDCVAAAGCTLMTYNRSAPEKEPREVYSVALIGAEVRAGRDQLVTIALWALSDSLSGDEVWPWTNNFLRPWLRVLAEAPRAQTLPLADFLTEHGPKDLAKTVDGLRSSHEHLAAQPWVRTYTEALAIRLKGWMNRRAAA